MVNTLRGTLKPFSGQNVTVQPISLENGLAHKASLPSVRAKVLGSLTGKTRRWVKSISLLKGIKILSRRRRVMWLVLLERDYGVRQNYRREITPLSIQASFLVEGKSECLTDKLVRDFE